MKKLLLLMPLPLLLMGWAIYKSSGSSLFTLTYLQKADKIEAQQQTNRILSPTTLNYTLNTSTVFITTPPTSPPYAPSDFSAINYPLISEAYATNCALAQDPTTIHAGAGGYNDVFFGGDMPTIDQWGASAAPIFVKQVFSLQNFPITLESNFYCRSSALLYNEYYFWMGSANPDYYNPSLTWFPDSDAQEGLLTGGFPNHTYFFNKLTSSQTQINLKDTLHTLANFGEWFNYKVTFDTLDGNIIAKDVMLDNVLVFPSYVVMVDMTTIDWEDNFRVAACVDDMAHDFNITYNDPLSAVEKIPTRPDFRAYPVPAQHQIQVDFDANLANINNLYIMDASGKQFSLPYELQSGKVAMDVSSLPTATYYLVLYYNDNQRHSIPFTKN